MAVTFTEVTSISQYDPTNSTTFNTPTLTPIANRLYVILIQGSYSGAHTLDSVSGGGLGTWTLIPNANVENSLVTRRCAAAYAWSSSPGAAAAIAIAWSSATTGCAYAVYEIIGFDTSNPIGNANTATGSATGGTPTLASATAGSGLLASCQTISNEAMSAEGTWTSGENNLGANPNTSMRSAFRTDATDLSCAFTWTTSGSYTANIIEILAGPPSTGITFINLGISSGTAAVPDIRETTDATSFTIPSWNPPDDGIVLLCIFNGEAAGQTNIDSVTGNGDTWVSLTEASYTSGNRRLSIFVAYGADLTTGATVIDFAGVAQTHCYVSIFHITGADESGVVETSPWVFSNLKTGDLAASTGTTIDFNAASHADNRAIAFLAHNADEVVSDDATWTKMDDMNGAGPAVGMITTVDEGGVRDPSFTWTTSAVAGYIGLEVKAAVDGTPVVWTPFPQVQDADTKSGVQSSDSTTWTLTYPTNLDEGDLILALMAIDGTVNVPTFPANWVVDRDTDSVNIVCALAKKKSLGTESGDFTVTLSAAQQGCWKVFRITNWYGILGTTLGNSVDGGAVMRVGNLGSGTTPDPAAFNPLTWDNEWTLWVAVGASDGGDTTYTGFPTDYTDTSAQESGGADGAALGIAMRHDAPITSENAGTFTTDVSEEWVTEIIAIRAIPVPPYVQPGRRIPRALYGPAPGIGDVQTFYTCPDGMRAIVRFVHVSNPTGSPEEFRLAIGDPDVQANQILRWLTPNDLIPPDSYRNATLYTILHPGETLQGYTAGTGIIRIDGYEIPAG